MEVNRPRGYVASETRRNIECERTERLIIMNYRNDENGRR